MLWDPKRDVKPDPLTLDSLIAWLETKPSDRIYCYDDTGRCLLAQYFHAMGYEHIRVTGRIFVHGAPWNTYVNGIHVTLPEHFDNVSRVKPHTFGAALKRARKYQAQHG